MSYIEKTEKILFEKINLHKEKYFNLEAVDVDFEIKIYDSFESLLDIKTLIQNRLKIPLKPLLSKIYIENRKRVRSEKDQFRKEISYKTQCLKRDNKMNLQDNLDKKVLIFNNIPYEHFKYLGLTTGTYQIKILNDHPFGILYDNEEFPNKESNYKVLEQNLKITGGIPYGEPKKITEDKWIMAPGDEPNNEDVETLINIGPYEFEVQFYTGTMTLEVTGDFGTVSYYCYNHGYMGGQKRLKYSDICLLPT